MRPCATQLLLGLTLLGLFEAAEGAVVEASTVSNVLVTATGWDLRAEADGGCGLGGCDPRLARDGEDNTVPDSRWSCEPSMTLGDSCRIMFALDNYFQVDHVVIYVHESDTAQLSIPFVLDIYGYSNDEISGLTSSGTPLGEGQQITVPSSADETTSVVSLEFTLTSGQYIGLSEVEIYLNVDDTDNYPVVPSDELYVVEATTVTNVVGDATFWELDPDAGCGEAGCTPRLAADGQDNTVSASRWACEIAADYDETSYYGHSCELSLTMDTEQTVSYVILYIHESDEAAKESLVFTVSGYPLGDPFESTPGTALGTGERFNLPRITTSLLTLDFSNVTASDVIAISEIEIYVEVTDTNVFVPAEEAWTEVTADTLTTVTALASGSLNDTSAGATRDGDDNTVATSRWSCDGGEWGYCVLFFEFNDQYTVSYLDLYMHEGANAAKEPVHLDFCNCVATTSSLYPGVSCDCTKGYVDPIMTYVTKPGTPLGEPERVNLLNPLTSSIGIVCQNLTAAGGTVDISEIEIYFEVPDSTPTPAPFVEDTPAPETTSDSAIAPSPLPEPSTTSSLGGTEDDDRAAYDEYYGVGGDDTPGDDDTTGVDDTPGDDDTPAGSIPSVTPTPVDGTDELDLLGSGGARATEGGPWVAVGVSVVGIGGSLLMMAMSAGAV